MIFRHGLFIAALIAAPAFATEPPPATQPSVASPAAPKDEGIICERKAETGSLVRKREVCTTRAQREQLTQDTKDMLNDMSRSVAPDQGN